MKLYLSPFSLYYGGRDGVFQFIKNPDGTINHRLFVPK